MLASVVANLPLPMSPLQVLWLNLVVHIFPAIALVVMPGEADLLRRAAARPPRAAADVAGDGPDRAAQLCCRRRGAVDLHGRRRPGEADCRSQTLAMATLALALLAQTLPALSEHRPFWTMGRSLTAPFWLALSGGLALQALAVFWPPLASLLPTARLSPQDWLHVLGMSVLALAVVEAGKALMPHGRTTAEAS